MPDPYSMEHAELIETAESLIRELLASRDGVQGGKVLYAQHLEYAERAQALAEVLRSVLFLTELNRYEAAFATNSSKCKPPLSTRSSTNY